MTHQTCRNPKALHGSLHCRSKQDWSHFFPRQNNVMECNWMAPDSLPPGAQVLGTTWDNSVICKQQMTAHLSLF
jgi:GMP synthase-like glutamine amidotransferase